MLRGTLAIVVIALLAVGCGQSGASPTAGPSPLPTKATLDGEALVAARMLPPEALSAEDLEAAGTAIASSGARIQLARASSPDLKEWELVSASPDGWRVWQPQAALAAIMLAGEGASVVAVERTDWPDSCLGAGRADEVCAQVITPGYRIAVSHDGKQLEYHSDLGDSVRLASQP